MSRLAGERHLAAEAGRDRARCERREQRVGAAVGRVVHRHRGDARGSAAARAGRVGRVDRESQAAEVVDVVRGATDADGGVVSISQVVDWVPVPGLPYVSWMPAALMVRV